MKHHDNIVQYKWFIISEFTTWPEHQNSFYVTTNAMSFEVKAPGNALVKLGRKPIASCDISVSFTLIYQQLFR